MKIVMLLVLLQIAAFAQATPPTQMSSLSASKAPDLVKLLRDDPLLRTPVTVDAVEQPLGDVLAALSPTLKLDLTAEQNVADQRVTLHVAGQPVYVLMGQLLLLLSHNSEHPYGYHWGSLERTKGERPDYQLWRDTASLAQEQEERDRPGRQLALMLQEWRHQAQLPPQKVVVQPGNTIVLVPDPDDPYNKALRSLTDEQLDALALGGIVYLNPSLNTPNTAAPRQPTRDEQARQDIHSALQVIPADEDFDAEFPDRAGQFDLCVGDVAGGEDLAGKGAEVLDTISTPENPDPLLRFISLSPDTGPKVDLAPYLAAKTVTPQQKGDLGFTLHALAKAARLNIYTESFLRTSIQNSQPHPGLDALQGSVPRLVAQICAVWNYHAEAIPGGYLFWSRTWAQDRARDVPERVLAPWRQRLKKNGVLDFYDRAEIASSLTWPQVALTVDPALFPDSNTQAGISGIYDYRELNLFGSLTPSEQAQALSPDGLAVSEMSARGQAALASNYRSRLVNVPGDQLMQAGLHFRTEDAPELNVQRLLMDVGASGQRLLEMRCIRPLQAGAIGKPALK